MELKCVLSHCRFAGKQPALQTSVCKVVFACGRSTKYTSRSRIRPLDQGRAKFLTPGYSQTDTLGTWIWALQIPNFVWPSYLGTLSPGVVTFLIFCWQCSSVYIYCSLLVLGIPFLGNIILWQKQFVSLRKKTAAFRSTGQDGIACCRHVHNCPQGHWWSMNNSSKLEPMRFELCLQSYH